MPENCDKDYGCEGCSFKGNCEAEREANKGKGVGVIDPNPYSKIKRIYAVMSGKGGVGKSMVTSLIASALNKKGFNVGILDADITGPSIPKTFGVKEKAMGTEMGIMPCMSKGGVEIMSINLLLEHDTDPVVWRGPIINGVIQQFYQEVAWGDVDFMLVDMPPGTGDVPLTVFQSLPIDGIIVVTSPQELVSMIITKAIKMAGLMNKNVIGVVENLSYFHCPDNGKDYKIFGESHVDEVAKEFNIPVTVKLPISPELARLQDLGNIEEASIKELEELVEYLVKN